MTTLICSFIGFIFTLISTLTSPLNPYSDSIMEQIDVIASWVATVYKVFDWVNFLVPLDVIYTALEIEISSLALVTTLSFIKWIIERITDVIP